MISANPVVSWEQEPEAECFTKPDGSRAYRLEESFLLTVDGVELLIPVPHEWDDASTPRPCRILIGKEELGVVGPCIHDKLYQENGELPEGSFTRKEADLILRACALREGIPRWRVEAAYRALRIGGWVAWNRYKRNRSMRS